MTRPYFYYFYKLRKFARQTWRRWSWTLYRKNRILRARYDDLIKDKEEKIKLHLGCGDKKLKEYINIDIFPCEGADMITDVTDLGIIPPESVDEILMESVLEHFYVEQQDKALSEYYRVLKKGGRFVINYLPDFDIVIDAYLKKEKGLRGGVFDLTYVRQFIFGERIPQNDLPALHKDIFTKESVKALVERNGFTIERLENVYFENEHIPVSIRVTAIK